MQQKSKITFLLIILFGCNQAEKINKISINCETSISTYSKIDNSVFDSIIGKNLFLRLTKIMPANIGIVNLDSVNKYQTSYENDAKVLLLKKDGNFSFNNQNGNWEKDSTSVFLKLNNGDCHKELFDGNFSFIKLSSDNYLFEHNIYVDTMRYHCKFFFSTKANP